MKISLHSIKKLMTITINIKNKCSEPGNQKCRIVGGRSFYDFCWWLSQLLNLLQKKDNSSVVNFEYLYEHLKYHPIDLKFIKMTLISRSELRELHPCHPGSAPLIGVHFCWNQHWFMHQAVNPRNKLSRQDSRRKATAPASTLCFCKYGRHVFRLARFDMHS